MTGLSGLPDLTAPHVAKDDGRYARRRDCKFDDAADESGNGQ